MMCICWPQHTIKQCRHCHMRFYLSHSMLKSSPRADLLSRDPYYLSIHLRRTYPNLPLNTLSILPSFHQHSILSLSQSTRSVLAMATTSDKSETGKICKKRIRGQFKGVRMRKWGRWVSEIRIPQTKYRIWLGSYETPEKAARAYDAALYCIHGSKGKFNFPNELRPEFPDGLSTSFFKSEIKAVASRFASLNSPSDLSSTSSFMNTTSSPNLEADALVLAGGETGSTWEAGGDMHLVDDGQPESDFFPPDNFLLDEPIMMEPDFIWDILDRN